MSEAAHLEDWRATIAERAAILELDGEMPRADAERAAIGEHLERSYASDVQLDGILGELIRAGRSAIHPDLRSLLDALGLLTPRTPIWGFAHVVPDGDGYRPASQDEFGRAAVIVPAFDRCRLADLVAEDLQSRRLLSRLGVTNLLGVDQVEMARETGQPLLIFDSALSWLRGHTLGAVIVDWYAVGHELDGVTEILCHPSIAPRLARCDPTLLAAPGRRNTGKENVPCRVRSAGLAAVCSTYSTRTSPRRSRWSPSTAMQSSPATVELLSAASVRAVRVGWLWEGWLARGKVHLLAGSPGTGKTTIAVSWCAAITAGGRWPDGADVEIGRLPDLVWGGWPWRCAGAAVSASGGDPKRLHFVNDVTERGRPRPFDPALDMPKLEAACRALPALKLIVFDPVVAVVTGDSHKNTETRRGLQPVVDLRQSLGARFSALRT